MLVSKQYSIDEGLRLRDTTEEIVRKKGIGRICKKKMLYYLYREGKEEDLGK